MPRSTPVMSNSKYEALRYSVQIVLPGLGTLYFTLAQIWGLPNAEQVVGTLAALTTFFGLLLAYAKRVYDNTKESTYDGTLVIDLNDPMKDTYSFELDTPFEDLNEQDEIHLRVQHD